MWIQLIIAFILVGLIIVLAYMIVKLSDPNPHQVDQIRTIFEPVMRGTATVIITDMYNPEQQEMFEYETIHNPNETYATFVERNIVHNNDSENVHETQVVKELRSRYARLIELNSNLIDDDFGLTDTELKDVLREQTYDQIQQLLTEKIEADHETLQTKSQLVIEKFRKNSPVVSLSQDPYDNDPPTDEDLLINVWLRIHAPDNSQNIDNLKTALFDQIIDCAHIDVNRNILVDRIREAAGLPPEIIAETISIVCPQGRVARLMQTFTMLDADLYLSRPVMDDAEYRNEAFSKAYALVQAELSDARLKKLYEADEDDLEPEQIVEVEKFKKTIKDKIRTELLSNYDGLLSTEKIETLIVDACMGV